MSTISGATLMGDVQDLAHRLPKLWQRVCGVEARTWKARKVAVWTRALSLEQARWVDARVADYIEALPFGRFERLVRAKIIEADPHAEEARRRAAAAERFVRTGQCNELGLKTLIAKAQAGDVIWFVAMADRIATILAANGDRDPADVRRSKAIGILANPARALALLTEFEQAMAADRAAQPQPGGAAGDARAADDAGAAGDTGAAGRPVRVDPRRLLPPVILYIHMGSDSFTRDPGPGWPGSRATGRSRCSRPGSSSARTLR